MTSTDNLKKQLETDVNGKKAGVYFDEQNASEECAKLEFKLNKINAELNKLLTNKATKDKDSIKNRSDEFGNDVIRYDITKLRQDIETVANAHFKKLDAKGILDCQQLIKEDYKSKPQSIKSYNLDFLALSRNVAKLVLTKVGKSYKIDELIQDAQLNNWVDAGLKLHENRNVCAFCEGSISEDRIRKIRQHFDEESEALKSQISAILIELRQTKSNLEFTIEINDYYSKFHQELVENIGILFDLVKLQIKSIDELIIALEDKKENLFKTLSFNCPNDYTGEIHNCLNKIESIRQNHITISNSLAAEQNTARNQLRLNEVFQFTQIINYQQLKTDLKQLESNLKNQQDIKNEPPRVSRRPNFLREYPNEKYLLT